MYHILGHHEYIVCLFPNSLFPLFFLFYVEQAHANVMQEQWKNFKKTIVSEKLHLFY